MLNDHANQTQEDDIVSPTTLSSSKTEQIQELVDILVSNYQKVNRGKPGQGLKAVLSGRDIPGHDLGLYETWLSQAHNYFRETNYQ
jgi:hypothetical protein